MLLPLTPPPPLVPLGCTPALAPAVPLRCPSQRLVLSEQFLSLQQAALPRGYKQSCIPRNSIQTRLHQKFFSLFLFTKYCKIMTQRKIELSDFIRLLNMWLVISFTGFFLSPPPSFFPSFLYLWWWWWFL